MKIENHRLVGEGISFRATPNHGGEFKPRFLVMHFTGGASASSSVEWLCNPQAKAAAHVVLGRDGSIVQLAPFNVVTWHAGVSQWNNLVGMNNFSIGIEMDNAGMLKRVGSGFQASFGKSYSPDEVLLAEHKFGGGVQPWQTYTEVQIARANELADLLFATYGLEDVLGHEDIARGRKSDPGPAFPLAQMRARLAGRKEDAPAEYVVTAPTLNIRKGPGAEHDTVAPPLRQGTRLRMLEAGDRWSRVEVVGPTDVEGWVANPFITPATAAAAAPGRAARAAPQRAARAAPQRASTARGAAPPAKRSPPAAAPKKTAARKQAPRAAAPRKAARKAKPRLR